MRGQRLFIRPIESDDRDAISAFLTREGEQHSVPACGLLGKLVGDLAAVLFFEVTDDGVRIDQLVVRGDLRRKRIGRFMVDELERFARKLDRHRLLAALPAATGFFRKAGFAEEGGVMVRRVK